MTSHREGRIDTAALQVLSHRLADGSRQYAPQDLDDAPELPGRTPGQALASAPRPPVGPRAVILDCGTSRLTGYTHVLWIAPNADAMIGSHVVEQLAFIVGRVVGVEAFAWEGNDRLHVRAPGLAWDDLLRDAQDALALHLATA
jgi:hypothetical protein